MELKPGYKQTEVGVIPEDWNIKSISQLGEIIRGASPRPKGDPRYYGGEIPRLMVEDVTRDGKFVIPQVDFLTEEGAKRSRPCKKGTLTIVCSGTVGVVSFLAVDACIHDGFLALLGIGKKTSSNYIYHQFTSLRQKLDSSATHGGVFTNLTTTGVKEFKIPIPPTLLEQEAIAEALSDADALIESLERLVAKKRHIKQGAMQELLTGKTRLEGFSGDWEEYSIGSIADPNKKWSFTGGPFGSNLKSSDYVSEGVRIIQLQNIGDGEFKNKEEVYTSYSKADELISCNIYPGEIILSKMGDPVARACLVPEYHSRYLMCSDGIRLSVDPRRFNTYFIYMSINSPIFRIMAENTGTGSTRKRIGIKELRHLTLSLPSLLEQEAIAAILSDMDAEIATLEKKLEKARAIKQGMMYNLLTGRIRLV
jgi:type I restriction enzyme, S subunit